MQTKLRGILVQKVPYRDRDLVGKVLLESGELASIFFYGGRGGGKKRKSSILELGYCLNIELKKGGRKAQHALTASEWQLHWHHQHIRFNYRAFTQLNFFLEFARKLAVDANLDFEGPAVHQNDGVYRVLSNALYFLDESVKNSWDPISHYFLFLGKMLFEMGVVPNLSHCVLCDVDLTGPSGVKLFSEHGGFACANCSQGRGAKSAATFRGLHQMSGLKYRDYEQISGLPKAVNDELFSYLCYQFNLNSAEFRSKPN